MLLQYLFHKSFRVSRKIYFSKSVSEDALKVFNQIANFENYSSYIPGCTKSELIEKQDEFEVGKLEFNFLLKDYSIKSKNVLSKNTIQIEQVDGPFNSFKGEWNIIKKNNSETIIEFNAEFELPFFINNMLPESVINNFCELLMNAFIKKL